MWRAKSSQQDSREDIRYSIFGEIPAYVILESTGELLTFVGVDISDKGLGLLLRPSPKIGQNVRLEFKEGDLPPLSFICRHADEVLNGSTSGLESMRRCGFELAQNQQLEFNLVELFARFDSVMIGD
jgi:hypothetical protein